MWINISDFENIGPHFFNLLVVYVNICISWTELEKKKKKTSAKFPEVSEMLIFLHTNMCMLINVN